jgi:hypothetical protein
MEGLEAEYISLRSYNLELSVVLLIVMRQSLVVSYSGNRAWRFSGAKRIRKSMSEEER